MQQIGLCGAVQQSRDSERLRAAEQRGDIASLRQTQQALGPGPSAESALWSRAAGPAANRLQQAASFFKLFLENI